jgi:hypothetical protein
MLTRLVPCLATVLLLLALAGAASAAPTFVPNLPNLYQHQKSPDSIDAASADRPARVPSYTDLTEWWEPDGGWCCITAIADLLYAIQKTRFPSRRGLFFDEPGHSWIEYMNYGIEKLEVDYFERELTFSRILRERGFSPQITYQEFYLDDGAIFQSAAPTMLCGACVLFPGTETTFRNMFEVYETYLRRGAYIALVMIADPARISRDEQERRGLWWGPGFHVVAGAGIDGTSIFVADPDENRTGENAGHGWDHRYLANLLEEGETVTLLPVDLEPIGRPNYASYRFDGNYFRSIDAADSAYEGVTIVRLIVLTVPGPGPALLLVAGSLMIVARSSVGRRRAGRQGPPRAR